MATVSVLNTDASLSGKTLTTNEGANTISGLMTFDRDPNPPFAVSSGSAVVPNLDAEKVGGIAGTALLPKTGGQLTGNLTFSADNTLDIGATGATRPRDIHVGRNIINPDMVVNGNSGASITINYTTGGPTQSVVRTANCTYTLTAPTRASVVVLKMIHEASASVYTVTFSPVPKYPGGVAPTWTNTSGAVDIITLFWDGTTWYGIQQAAFA